MKAFTIYQKQKYIENHGSKCPICDSENIYCIDKDIDDISLYSYMACRDCKIHFTEEYRLINIELDEE